MVVDLAFLRVGFGFWLGCALVAVATAYMFSLARFSWLSWFGYLVFARVCLVAAGCAFWFSVLV